MPADARPGSPGASTDNDPVRKSPRQIVPSVIEPTKNDVPRPLSIPSGKDPFGRSIRAGKLQCRPTAEAPVAGARPTNTSVATSAMKEMGEGVRGTHAHHPRAS